MIRYFRRNLNFSSLCDLKFKLIAISWFGLYDPLGTSVGRAQQADAWDLFPTDHCSKLGGGHVSLQHDLFLPPCQVSTQ